MSADNTDRIMDDLEVALNDTKWTFYPSEEHELARLERLIYSSIGVPKEFFEQSDVRHPEIGPGEEE